MEHTSLKGQPLNRLFLAISLFSLALTSLSNARAASIRSGEAVNDFGQLFLDKDNRSAADVFLNRAKLFDGQGKAPKALGFVSDPAWMMIDISAADFPSVVFESTNPAVEAMQIFQFNGKGETVAECTVGTLHPLSKRGVYYRHHNCKMNVLQDANTFIIRFPVSNKPLISEVILWDAKDFEIHAANEASWLNMNLGAVFMIGVVNLFIYFSTREKTYLLYGTYIIFLFLSLFTMLGIATFFDATREAGNWALNHGIFVSTSFSMAFALLFSREFLNMKSYMPIFGRVLLLCAAFSLTNGIIMIVHASTLQIAGHLFNATLSTSLLLIGGIRASLRNYKPAYLYSAAWIILLIANIHVCIGYAGIVEWDRSIVRNFVFGSVVESLVLSFALGYRINLIQKHKEIETTKKDHYFHQMAKVFYPHQLQMIQDGKILEETMPTTPGEACVISFDIIASSKIQHARAKEFFRNVFRRCYEEMTKEYDVQELRSNAFRIKEMGDGFLCSVGYPFRARSENPANDAVQLAFKFQHILVMESAILQQTEPVTCGIGISLDTITGFYPEFGTKEYDLYGRAIILATRYESMRKILFEKGATSRSTIILQEKVYCSIDPTLRREFTMVDLEGQGIPVRDDPSATKLYFKHIGNQKDLKLVENPPQGDLSCTA